MINKVSKFTSEQEVYIKIRELDTQSATISKKYIEYFQAYMNGDSDIDIRAIGESCYNSIKEIQTQVSKLIPLIGL